MKKIIILVFAVASLLCFSVTTSSAAVQWSVNGHYYEVVDDTNATWQSAKLSAESMGGYLATMTTSAENLWLTNTFGYSSLSDHFLGGYQSAGSSEPDGGWTWITGESWSFTNWAGGEPNDNYGVGENALQYLHGTNSNGGLWNDYSDTLPTLGYVVEYNSAPPIVPEPISSILFVTGGTLLAGRRYIRRKKTA